MSIHPSLKKRNTQRRSVLKRHERLAKAIRTKKWFKGMSVFGLPKYNPIRFKKIKKEETEETKTTLGTTDVVQEHMRTKEQSKKSKYQQNKKETTGRR